MDAARPADHGEFSVTMSRNDELKVVRSSMAQARANKTKPGHHWQRFVGKVTGGVGPSEIIKLYHVDLNAGVVEITETQDGKETARRTVAVDNFG